MAIRIDIEQTERELFCCTKWWGDPDMQADMQYPMMEVPGGEYPLTFICQIDCEEASALDPSGLLPKEGMLYFFAAIDSLIGYDSPVTPGKGEWPKGTVMVKYVKSVNFETFNSCILTGENGESIAERAMLATLSQCDDGFGGIRMLGEPLEEGTVNLLQIAFDPENTLSIWISESDLRYGNWKRARATLRQSSACQQ